MWIRMSSSIKLLPVQVKVEVLFSLKSIMNGTWLDTMLEQPPPKKSLKKPNSQQLSYQPNSRQPPSIKPVTTLPQK